MKCDVAALTQLVTQGKDPGSECDAIADHLEHCPQCRDALAEIGGQPDWWQEARTWLSGDEDTDVDQPIPLPIDLSFLDEPSHPEMLGRIGKYDVEGVIGNGGMGIVLRGHDVDLHRTVAIKVMAPCWAASESARRRFAREAKAAASVSHDNVIPIYNVEATANLPYLVMRYVPGLTLDRWVQRNGHPDVSTILRVAGQLAEGLAAAHRRGLVHRDIKPGNVLVGENIERVWITDFGLAQAADSTMLTRTGVIAGTPHYMSPEQIRGDSVDHRSDLFSLGALLYFLSTGKAPFDADSTLAVLHAVANAPAKPLQDHRTDLPPSFVSLVRRLLSKSPDRRPKDCQDVSDQIARSIREHEQGKSVRFFHHPRWRKTAVAIAGTLLIAIAGISMSQGFRGPSASEAGRSNSKQLEQYADRVSIQLATSSGAGEAQFRQDVRRIDQSLHQVGVQPNRLDLRSAFPRLRQEAANLRNRIDGLNVNDAPFVVSEPDFTSFDTELLRLQRSVKRLESTPSPFVLQN